MRLDKLLSECGIASRSESAKACRNGSVTVNGAAVRSPALQVDPERDRVVYGGVPVVYRKFVYLMLNKPDGYVSATEDGNDPVVTELVPEEYRRMGVFPCGRLDKHTLGFLLLSNDGALCHRLLAPKSHVTKEYRFGAELPVSGEKVARLEAGVNIGGYVTRPCTVRMESDRSGVIVLTEGKYHQIRRMFEAIGNRIVSLERISFGPLRLDPSLPRGAWRELSAQELDALTGGHAPINQNQEKD